MLDKSRLVVNEYISDPSLRTYVEAIKHNDGTYSVMIDKHVIPILNINNITVDELPSHYYRNVITNAITNNTIVIKDSTAVKAFGLWEFIKDWYHVASPKTSPFHLNFKDPSVMKQKLVTKIEKESNTYTCITYYGRRVESGELIPVVQERRLIKGSELIITIQGYYKYSDINGIYTLAPASDEDIIIEMI